MHAADKIIEVYKTLHARGSAQEPLAITEGNNGEVMCKAVTGGNRATFLQLQ